MELLALGIFCSYFLLIIGLFSIILRSLPPVTTYTSAAKQHIYVFWALTVVSLLHTWFYMFKFMKWSFLNHEDIFSGSEEVMLDRISSWLSHTALFEQAWVAVSFGCENWWWSEQLCLFTACAWTIFLVTEGRRNGVKHLWAYMLLGQLVAISVASSLFYLALILSRTPPKPSKAGTYISMAPPILYISVLLSLVTVGISPFTSERTFLPNLLLMHALLLVPFVSFRGQKAHDGHSNLSIRTSTLYSLTTILAIALRVRTCTVFMLSLPTHAQSPKGMAISAWEVLHSHPAQSSIGWDVIWTSISFTVWIAARKVEKFSVSVFTNILALLVACSLGSVGVTAPYILEGSSL